LCQVFIGNPSISFSIYFSFHIFQEKELSIYARKGTEPSKANEKLSVLSVYSIFRHILSLIILIFCTTN